MNIHSNELQPAWNPVWKPIVFGGLPPVRRGWSISQLSTDYGGGHLISNLKPSEIWEQIQLSRRSRGDGLLHISCLTSEESGFIHCQWAFLWKTFQLLLIKTETGNKIVIKRRTKIVMSIVQALSHSCDLMSSLKNINQNLFDTDNNHSSFLFVSPRKAISLIWISKKTKFGPCRQSHWGEVRKI